MGQLFVLLSSTGAFSLLCAAARTFYFQLSHNIFPWTQVVETSEVGEDTLSGSGFSLLSARALNKCTSPRAESLVLLGFKVQTPDDRRRASISRPRMVLMSDHSAAHYMHCTLLGDCGAPALLHPSRPSENAQLARTRKANSKEDGG